MQKIIPARLRPGDEIRVIAPASGIKIIAASAGKSPAGGLRKWACRFLRHQRRRRKLGRRRLNNGRKKNRRHCRSFRRSESQSGIHHDRRQQLQPAA